MLRHPPDLGPPCNLGLGYPDLPEQLGPVDQGLVLRGITEDRRAAPVLIEDDRPRGSPDLAHHGREIGSEARQRRTS